MTDVKIEYYQAIHDLPLNKFIDCIVDGNLSALTISGFPTPEQLQRAWDFILSEYSELVGSAEYRMYVELYREVEYLKITLNQISLICGGDVIIEGEIHHSVGQLNLLYNDYWAKQINELLNTNIVFNWRVLEEYEAQIAKCIRRSKSIKIKYDLKVLQFKAIEKKNNAKKGEKMDRQYFVSILVTLSDFAKYRIDETIKMSEYCERIRRFSDYCETVKKQT